ncbi:MAG TPA: choice-of-anchor V domain-containing protein [Bryobacteraceae bacterium]|nr:choice-of-anchor V domain-containing protein [Bryobacteraceae bacterium]
MNFVTTKQHKGLRAAKFALAAMVLPILIYAFAEGPPPRVTGAPGDHGNCTGCHAGTASSGKGNVKITFPGGLSYTPGVTQHLTLVVSDPDQHRWGFELSARVGSNAANGQAGDFTTGSDGFTQVICDDGSIKTNGTPCPASTPVEFIEHTTQGTRPGQTGSAAFEFDWTPPKNDVGDVVFYAAANAANGDFSPSGDHIYTAKYTLHASTGGSTPAITAVVNGADFQPRIAQSAWITVTGSKLATKTRTAGAHDIVNGHLPTQLETTTVTVGGKPAFVEFISPTQINALAPDGISGSAQIVVSNGGVSSAPANTTVDSFAPAFFTWPGNYAVATHQDFTLAVKAGEFPGKTTTPAKPGEVVILWGTGFGPTNPEVPAGETVPGDKLYKVTSIPAITVGGISVSDYFGTVLAPGFAGLYQLAFRVPESVPDGDSPIVVQIGGVSSPSNVLLTVHQ